MREVHPEVLKPERFKHYVDHFNALDEELYVQHIPNSHAWEFLSGNIPWFECPDEDLERTYYFRWWTYRKHIKQTTDGIVVSEFLPNVPWAGKHNTINLSAAMHIYEGRWLRTPLYLDDYARFWFRKGGALRSYTAWLGDAIWARACVTGDFRLGVDLLGDLVANFHAWQRGWPIRFEESQYQVGQRDTGLFFQLDDREGTEMSISGHGFRPFTNSAMFGEAMAINRLAEMTGNRALADNFEDEAGRIRDAVLEKLWDPQMQFFLTLEADGRTSMRVRELNGYTPWYFLLANPGKEQAWSALLDPQGFFAPYGPTFAEQRHPKFTISYEGHECQWNGPSWPMSTSLTLTALANLLNYYPQDVIAQGDYLKLLKIYAASHRRDREDGQVVPWIDENLNPFTGDWISRTRLKTWENGTWSEEKGGRERGKDYNHSTFCDLIISGLVGLRPRQDETIEVNPLASETWDYFCLDQVSYHSRSLTILWDRRGDRYGWGKGLTVLDGGRMIANRPDLGKIVVDV